MRKVSVTLDILEEELENEWLSAEVKQVRDRLQKGEEAFESLEIVITELRFDHEISKAGSKVV